MRRRLLGVWFCFAFVLLAVSCCAEPLPIAAPESVGLSPERLSKLGKFLTDEIDNNNLPGAVVAVARRGRLAYFEALGFQDKPAGKAMRKDAIFRVYSMTKPWTSVAAMMLVEEGRIQLTDPVSKYLPSFRNLRTATREAITAQSFDIAADREPTIQNLLTHTSGLAYDFLTKNSAVKEAYQAAGFQALGRDIRDKMTAAEFTERLSKLPLANQPGATWEYGLSTAVLGRVIEAVSGVPLSRFLEERLFLPLGMTDSGFVVAKDKADRIAQPLLPYETIEIFDPVIPAANDLGGEGGFQRQETICASLKCFSRAAGWKEPAFYPGPRSPK
jgi:CubicO group peptidase (beta-lactamase class C family)